MYEFCDVTWNPIKGECIHDCSYCFMKGIRHRFKQDATLRLDAKYINQSLGSGKYVFVGSSTDMFASDVRDAWITVILDHLANYPDNIYHLQSKNPARFLGFTDHPLFADHNENLILATTVESDINYSDVSSAPAMADRVAAMKKLSDMGFKVAITIEPIMKFSDAATFTEMLASVVPVQVNIGANSSRSDKLSEPSKSEVLALINELESLGIKVHRKSNLDRLLS